MDDYKYHKMRVMLDEFLALNQVFQNTFVTESMTFLKIIANLNNSQSSNFRNYCIYLFRKSYDEFPEVHLPGDIE